MPARTDPALARPGDGTTVVRTVCPRNCYCTCGMVVTLEDGRITRIEGDPENSATAGHVCLKGISYARRMTTGDRLLHPMKRQADGSFARVSWDEALADIASRLERLRREHGPESVLYYDASGSHGALGRLAMAFWHQFGGCTLTYGDLCWPAGLEATRLTYGANLHNHPRLTSDSRLILLWGHNPAETNVHQMRWIHEAQERGATVALIDPRSTDTSDAADIHLQPRPGTDAALALGMARVIVDNGLHDTAFLERHAVGVERYLERLREYPLAHVAAITGLHELDIARLAIDYARAKPALLIAGFGLQRHHHAGQTMRAVSLLAALTGNIGVAGGGWQYANLASHCLKDPPLPPEPPRVRRAAPVSRLGPTLAELDAPRVAAAWVEKGNPVSQNPRSPLVREAFERLDLLVVVDQFMTDTARLAHYVLPAKTMFEEEDLVTAYWHPYLQRRAKLWDPPGEVKTETEIWRLLSERFGADTRYFPQGDAETRELLLRMLPDSADPVGRPFRVASDATDTVGRPAGVASDATDTVGRPFRVASDLFERLSRQPVDPSGAGDVAFADFNFPTPSGKIEFASEQAARLWGVDPVPDYVPLTEGHDSPLAARFPLQLLSCKTRDRIHSQFGNLDWVREVERPHRLDMHPADAGARGLAEGDKAVVWNDRGRITLGVRLDEGLRPGVVHVLEGRCHEGDPDINQLTDAGVTDINHGATFYECLVEVAREDGKPRRGGAAAGSARAVRPRPARSADSADQAPVSKPVAPVPQNGFLIDLGRCVGCGACVLACRLENGWPSETPWRRVLPLNLRRRPGGPTYFLSVACHHCEHPACVAACPSRAYEKRPDGTVVHHADLCIGCRYCEMACPFGAPQYDAASGVMTKCDFCQHEVGRGFSLAAREATLKGRPTDGAVGQGFSLAAREATLKGRPTDGAVGQGFSLAAREATLKGRPTDGAVGQGFSLAAREATLKGRPTDGAVGQGFSLAAREATLKGRPTDGAVGQGFSLAAREATLEGRPTDGAVGQGFSLAAREATLKGRPTDGAVGQGFSLAAREATLKGRPTDGAVGQGFSLASREATLEGRPTDGAVGQGFSLAARETTLEGRPTGGAVGQGFSLASRETTLEGRPTGGEPACVAACPTGALRALPAAAHDGTRAVVPGFADPAGCGPNIRFIAPRGRRRAALYQHLQAVLRRRG